MNVLIILAHENPGSLLSTLTKYAAELFGKKGYTVTYSDLYKQGFNPVGGKADFTHQENAKPYQYLQEQGYASRHNSFTRDITDEMDKLLKADLVVFAFPIWWYSVPAILKGWFDRILANGFAYGGQWGTYEEGRFSDKRVAFIVTLDGTRKNFTKEGKYKSSIHAVLYPLRHGTLGYCGFLTLNPLFIYEAYKVDERTIPVAIRKVKRYVGYVVKKAKSIRSPGKAAVIMS